MSLVSLWFYLVVFALAGYVVLDGFDIGAALVQPFVAKSPAERRLVAATIGPVWDGNEVWLLAAGGTLVFAFPRLYAAGISGFYLPVMMLLWLYVFRGLGVEMRHFLDHPLWDDAWAVAFWASSFSIALFLSMALGNIVRGVSIDESGRFFAPLWTDLRVGESVGIVDWYTLLVGALGVSALGLHGSLWLAHRAGGPVAERAHALARKLVLATLGLTAAVTVATTFVQPLLLDNLKRRPWGIALALLAVAALGTLFVSLRAGRAERAFYASSAFLAGMVASAAFGVSPYVLPGRIAARGIVAEAASSPDIALGTGLFWWIPGMTIAFGYFVYNYRKLPRGLTTADLDEH